MMIGKLFLFVVTLFPLGYAHAGWSRQVSQQEHVDQQDTIRKLDQVTVTAKSQAALLEAKPLAVKSVDIKAVIHQNAVLSDVADRISGVRIRRSGSLGDRSDVSINGIRGAGIRVYVDGLPMEILYPSFDISTIPLSNIMRVDVYKGAVPIDVGTDAMGGAVNIITEKRYDNTLRAGYYLGSFNTHMADIHLGLAHKNGYFMNVSGAMNYSDNDYKIKAFVFENNQTETVKRFHDAYQRSFLSLDFGVHGRPWADELRFSANYSDGYKEMQHGTRLTTTALGEVKYNAHNYSGAVRYLKYALDGRLRLHTLLNLGNENLAYRDTSRNAYSWSGLVIGQRQRGELSYGLNDNRTQSVINRSTVTFDLSPNHRITASNVYASQRRTGENYLTDFRQGDYIKYPQRLVKDIAGLAYEGRLWEKLSVTAAGKRYHFRLQGVENNTFEAVEKSDDFLGYNLAARYEFDSFFYAKASYERGFLIPYFEQFVGDGATILRNINLRPESSDNVNASLGYEREWTPDWFSRPMSAVSCAINTMSSIQLPASSEDTKTRIRYARWVVRANWCWGTRIGG